MAYSSSSKNVNKHHTKSPELNSSSITQFSLKNCFIKKESNDEDETSSSKSDLDLDNETSDELEFEEDELVENSPISNDENTINGISDQYFLRKTHKKDDKFFETLESLDIDENKFNDIVQHEYKKISEELEINLKPNMSLHFSMLKNNFNLILYGFGSKIKILDHFIECYLKGKHHYIVIRGYSPDITLNDLLFILNRSIGCELNTILTTNHDELIKKLNEKFQNSDLFLVIHSIDRLIQDRKNIMKNFFLKLFTSVQNIHFIASVDHVNFEFLWTNIDIDILRLHMLPINTYEPYLQERRSINGGQLICKSKSSQISNNFTSISYVYESLNDNAKKIFVIVLKYFIQTKSAKSTGLKFDELYQICREEFLTSSVITVRQQLTEFKDHKLLKFKNRPDGSECLMLCFDIEVAKKFLDSIQEQ